MLGKTLLYIYILYICPLYLFQKMVNLNMGISIIGTFFLYLIILIIEDLLYLHTFLMVMTNITDEMPITHNGKKNPIVIRYQA